MNLYYKSNILDYESISIATNKGSSENGSLSHLFKLSQKRNSVLTSFMCLVIVMTKVGTYVLKIQPGHSFPLLKN